MDITLLILIVLLIFLFVFRDYDVLKGIEKREDGMPPFLLGTS